MTIKCDECGRDMMEDSSQPYQSNRIPMVLFRCKGWDCDRTLAYTLEELEDMGEPSHRW